MGHKFIFNVYKNLDLRLEGYLFKPFEYADIITDINDIDMDGNTEEEVFIRNNSPSFIGSKYYTIATANAVYKTPLGPLSFSVNYYYNLPEISVYKENQPVTFFFHFGYILFNDRALK